MTYVSAAAECQIQGTIDPMKEKDFSAFVFKIQANMNKAHRDRIAFMRICSGKFDSRDGSVRISRGAVKVSPFPAAADDGKRAKNRLTKPMRGDIIGVFDPGIFSIGDTLTTSKERFAYEGIPTFAPEHFARVRQVDTMKTKTVHQGNATRSRRKVRSRFSRNTIRVWRRSLSA